MPNTSATGGALLPLAVANEIAVENVLQQVIANTMGMGGQYVIPRWQPEPPTIWDRSIDWAALGITERRLDTFAFNQHNPVPDGSENVQRQEEFEMLVSIYGPNARTNATTLIQGLAVRQNTEPLDPFDIQFVGVDAPLAVVPELLKGQWLYRVDITLQFRRWLSDTYAILSILSALIKIYYETGEVDVSVIPNLQVSAAEIPNGLVDGANLFYTLAHQPNPTLGLQLFVDDGVNTPPILQRQNEEYTLSGNTITFAVALTPGHRLLAFYYYIN